MTEENAVDKNSICVASYKYGSGNAGNRTSKITEAETITYLNDINGSLTQVLAEIGSDGNLKCWYTRGTELISQERNGVVSYYLTDGHGSVRHLTDSEGNITDSYVYDAWGNMISSEGETENSYLYCGEQFDNATGLYYLRARYMDPSTGTFISMDTYQGSIFDPVSLHKYLYANANPVMNVDPSGYFSLAEISVSSAINDILDSQAYANYVMIYQKIKGALNVIDTLCTIYDIGREILMAISDPNKSGWDILEAAARGIVTGVLINRMCQIKRIGPILSKIFMAFGAAGQFESIITNIKEGNIDLAVTGTIQLLIQIMSVHQTCFTGETLVAAENGQVRIDEIKVGDKVWAYDIHTGKTELKEVLTVYVHDQTEILHLHTTVGDIDTTTNHPFYVTGRGWVAAGDINEGDEVFLIDGSTAVVAGAELGKLEEPIKVYNLEVEDYNTFFVGDEAVLVHNYIGDNGTNTSSETTWQNGKTERIDVENPPRRDGNIHYHDKNNEKYYYDFDENTFIGLSKKAMKKLMNDPKFNRGLKQALKILLGDN
jgi:RHS repeat-associated protein